VKTKQVRFANFCYEYLTETNQSLSAQALVGAFVEAKGTVFAPNFTSAAIILRRDGRFRWTDEKRAVYTVAK